ncbi:D-xylose-proton symporter-like 2 [Rhododendron vialii]|uniref:D-xylose-proton symporter-like 2 n=1 Tax=Rhododendron vialii TaxID=182163 RepID=UPI00265FB3A7|nr:D-xylose-proton symporter-like 2 [Rhododendron vialii]
MASRSSDPEQPSLSSLGNVGKSSGEIDDAHVPLVNGERHYDSYSVLSAVLPFLFPALGGLLYGYDIGATSCATISVESATLSGTTWYDLSSVDIGLITSGSLYGALIGSVLAFNVADFLGRRRELIVASVLYLVGALVTALAPDFVIMVIGRFVFGIGIGLAMHAAPMYIAETAPSQIRGQLISLKEFFIVLGMVAGYALGSLLVDTVSGWRYMYGASTPIAVVMGIGMWWLPASPRWLLLCAIQGKGNMQNLRETAVYCLCRLRGEAIGDSAPEQVEEMLGELSYVGEEKEAGLAEMFQGKCLKALIIGAGLVLFQQITGQPSVLYYAASILESAGFSEASDATRVSILLGLLKLIMTGVAVVVVDRVGRRPLLLGGVSVMVISLFLLGSYYTFLDNAPVMAVVALLLYVGCYQLSFGPIGWLMISEIFPLRLRGRGLSIAVLVNFGANAIVTFSFSPLKALLGAGALFFIFGGIAIISLAFIYFIVPETKGLSLEEIEAKLL